MKKYLIPTERSFYILGGILLLILIISFLTFPYASLMSMSPDASPKFEIGWPVSYITLDLTTPESIPIKWIPLIFSLLIYCIISYGIDILISVIMSGLIKPKTLEDLYIEARKAYYYQKNQGMAESKIEEMFKAKGWKQEDIERLKH